MREMTASMLTLVLCVACTVRPQGEPSEVDLEGTYVLTETPASCRSAADAGRSAAVVQLGGDGSFMIDRLPSCFANDREPSSIITDTIAGQWSITKLEGDYVLGLLVKSGPLQHGWNVGVEIRGRSAPFELYFRVGDPDEQTGLVFNRT